MNYFSYTLRLKELKKKVNKRDFNYYYPEIVQQVLGEELEYEGIIDSMIEAVEQSNPF